MVPQSVDVKAMAAGDGFFESHDDISSTALARKNSLWKGIQRIPLILEEIDKPVVAKIHGAAVGAGLDMALMCDVRIAGESASMSESYFNAGIVPGDGGAYFLPRLVGRDKALDLFWTARTLKGKEAADMGQSSPNSTTTVRGPAPSLRNCSGKCSKTAHQQT